MTNEEFVEKYSFAPYDTDTIARIVIRNIDLGQLHTAALNFIEAKTDFEQSLEEIGFEVG